MPIDDQLRVTPPRKQPTRITLVGGPHGMRPYLLPHEAVLGLRIVLATDPNGTRIQPIVYEIRGERNGEWWAGHAGFATEDDIALWRRGPTY